MCRFAGCFEGIEVVAVPYVFDFSIYTAANMDQALSFALCKS